jgi:hypothetical protein
VSSQILSDTGIEGLLRCADPGERQERIESFRAVAENERLRAEWANEVWRRLMERVPAPSAYYRRPGPTSERDLLLREFRRALQGGER